MSQIDQQAVELFKSKAKLASIEVSELKDVSEAIERAAAICAAKEPVRIGRNGEGTDSSAAEKILAAPDLSEEDFKALSRAAEPHGVKVIRRGMRQNLAGIEVAFTLAEMGIAVTATSVLSSQSEELRLATMVCEAHVVALPKSKVVEDSYQAEDLLADLLGEKAMYAAFISGPSRTADIERVLTIGVHGPVEMHVLLLND